MRGGSPACSPGVITVGNVWTGDPSLGYAEQKASSSDSGPRVDTWAPGTYIVSSMASTNAYGCTAQYPLNSSFLIGSLVGTSQASPQVAGVCAQLLQVYPTATPAQIRTKIINNSTDGILYDTGVNNDYAVPYTLHGAPNKYTYQPFNTASGGNITGAITSTHVSINT